MGLSFAPLLSGGGPSSGTKRLFEARAKQGAVHVEMFVTQQLGYLAQLQHSLKQGARTASCPFSRSRFCGG